MLKYTNKPPICSIFAPMVRIGRQILHFSEVDPGSVKAEFSEDRRFRYLLERSILNLFALRAADAADLNRECKKSGEEAVVGPSNDHELLPYLEKKGERP
jgi:hypothetical protein